MKRKNEEIEVVKKETMVPIDIIRNTYNKYTNGYDYIDSEHADLSTIPCLIEHSTYLTGTAVKPFGIIADKMTNSIPREYFRIMSDSAEYLNINMLNFNISNKIRHLLHPYFLLINDAMKKSLILYENHDNHLGHIDTHDYIIQATNMCINNMQGIFNVNILTQVEGMLAMYIQMEGNTENVDITLPRTLVSPLVNEAVMGILTCLYNYAVTVLYETTLVFTLYDREFVEYSLAEMEKMLYNPFIYIHNNLIDELGTFAVSLLMSRSRQDLDIPKIE